jgi:hypothetical protein
MKKLFTLFGIVVLTVTLLIGCATSSPRYAFVGTGTTVGFDVSASPATQTPQATLAYKRVETVLVPIATNGVTPDVITEFVFHTDLFSSNGGIYSRIAIGSNATTQLPAALMMSKTKTGQMPTNILDVVSILSQQKEKK